MKYVLCIIAALFLLSACSVPTAPELNYQTETPEDTFVYQWADPQDAYYQRMRNEVGLDSVVAGAENDLDKASKIAVWVSGLWIHKTHTPGRIDPITLIQGAKSGERYSCIEYSSVVAASLIALGIPARVIGLWQEGCETMNRGSSHVAAEFYYSAKRKWVMVDGQWGMIPILNGNPLSAFELYEALAEGNQGVDGVTDIPEIKKQRFFDWILPYLYYFQTRLDQRYPWYHTGTQLILKPIGAISPEVREHDYPVYNAEFSTYVQAYYPTPEPAGISTNHNLNI